MRQRLQGAQAGGRGHKAEGLTSRRVGPSGCAAVVELLAVTKETQTDYVGNLDDLDHSRRTRQLTMRTESEPELALLEFLDRELLPGKLTHESLSVRWDPPPGGARTYVVELAEVQSLMMTLIMTT